MNTIRRILKSNTYPISFNFSGMNGFCTIFLIILLVISTSAKAQWVSFDGHSSNPSEPKVTLISNDRNSTVIQIELSGILKNSITSDGSTFDRLDLLSDIFMNEQGAPSLPYIAKVLAIPDDASVSFEILEVGNTVTLEGIDHVPARESWIEGMPETQYLQNEDLYSSDKVFPGELVNIEAPSVFRDFRISRVSFFPVRYFPARNEIQIVTSMTVKINYGNGEVINPKSAPKREIAPSFGALYRSLIFNYDEVLKAEYNGKEDAEEVLLYIVPDNFYSYFTEYFEWKRISGWKVIVTKFSDISATATNPTTIFNHVSNLYLFSQDPPTYVIIVGDDGVFPKKIVTYSGYSFPDEDYFVKVDGTDFFPEMLIGRIPNQSADKLQLMLKKAMMYEKTPYMADTTWFRKGICCSNNEYVSQIATKRFAAQLLMNPGNFISVDTLMSNGIIGTSQGCTVNLSMILAAINEGRSFLNYRGEGWSSGWWANCYPFNTSDVNNIQNGEKFTFVTSIGCGVSMFNAGGGNCFGEQWMKLGTVDSPRGSVNFIGPTSNTHTAYNNDIDMGIYIGLFQEGMNTPGQALLRGKLFMYQELGGTDPYVEYHYRVYCDLGDPSTRIWKTTPRQVTAIHPLTLNTGTNSFDIDVSYLANGFPVIDANVNITGDYISANKRTDNLGKSNFSLDLPLPDTLNVTITGPGILPYYSTIKVTTSSAGQDEFSQSGMKLNQNIPNPFLHQTDISYYINRYAKVSLKIFNMKGALVQILTDEYQSPGQHTVTWNGKDVNGSAVKPGTYFYVLQTDTEISSLRMIKLK